MLQVVPAYGRDYKSRADVLGAWNAGRDFQIADLHHPWDGSYVNKADYQAGQLKVRYDGLRRVCVLDCNVGGAI